MPETCLNLIGGAWVAGDHAVENRNPSDLSDLVGMFTQASASQLDDALEAAAERSTDEARQRALRRRARKLR